MEAYDHKKIEKKWQEQWEKDQVYKTEDTSSKPKHYVLDMFPYPSGEGLHVGHPKGYIASDIYSRFKRMNGFNVLHPMGWDAFGLPAENFAIKNKVHPSAAVKKNIARFKEQLSIIGFDYDWSREINTTDPAYYKWTQWIFLKLLEKGLAFESHEPINWCPSCQTGLANEDLDGGRCERCDSEAEKKPMRQWVLKITDYADRLIKDLDLLDWPDSIKTAQRNWIGRSEGHEVEFTLANSTKHKAQSAEHKSIKVFTTRLDTIYGATYLVVAPENPFVESTKHKAQNSKEVQQYLDDCKKKTEIERTSVDKEKTGVELKGIKAINPATGEEISVWVADYVLGHYGTGAVMAVPAHDERDHAFAKKYGLPIKHVVMPHLVDYKVNPPRVDKPSKTRRNVHAIVFDPKENKYLILRNEKQGWDTIIIGGIEDGEDPVAAARREVEEESGYTNLIYKRTLGAPVQASYFAKHKDENRVAVTTGVYFELVGHKRVPITDEIADDNEVLWVDANHFVPGTMVNTEMPLWIERMMLSGDVAYTGEGVLSDSGEFSGLTSAEGRETIAKKIKAAPKTTYKLRDWVFSRQRYWGEPIPVIHCLLCGVVPVSEDDLPITLPPVEQYAPTGTGESPLANIDEWVNTVCPSCGGAGKRETNTMPQWAGSSWYYLRFMDPHNDRQLVSPQAEKYWSPVDVYVGGDHAVRHLIYARFWHKFLHDIGVVSTSEPFARLEFLGFILAEDGRKMAKRWGNVINPDDIVSTYGADSLRLYEMFMGPFENAIAWQTKSIIGVRRFLERIWSLREKVKNVETPPEEERLLHQTIKKAGEDIAEFKFNTAVSAMMILVNGVEKMGTISRSTYMALLRVLAPFAPHMAEELWQALGNTDSVHRSSWPVYDPAKLVSDEHVIAVQIDGKSRDTFITKEELDETSAREQALARPKMQKWLEGRTVTKVIYIPNKLINIVTG